MNTSIPDFVDQTLDISKVLMLVVESLKADGIPIATIFSAMGVVMALDANERGLDIEEFIKRFSQILRFSYKGVKKHVIPEPDTRDIPETSPEWFDKATLKNGLP